MHEKSRKAPEAWTEGLKLVFVVERDGEVVCEMGQCGTVEYKPQL